MSVHAPLQQKSRAREAAPSKARRAPALSGPRAGQLAEMEDLANQSDQARQTARLREVIEPVQKQENRTGMPDHLKTGLEQLSGTDLSGVRVHYNSGRPAQLNALAYAQGQDIYVGPGQQKHLPHEGWHAVQQMQGRVRPTTQMQGVPINDSPGLEKEADAMGRRALYVEQHVEESSDVLQPKHEPVIQRAMGMEVEVRRKISTPQGKEFKGDTEILEHDYFTLVTDFQKDSNDVVYSNLEFVMKHFDQLAGKEDEAIAELKKRIGAMKKLADALYLKEGKLGELVTIGKKQTDPYQHPSNADHSGARISAVKGEDKRLYVHYTVGFEPKHWFKMVQDVTGATREAETSRAKPYAGSAQEVVGVIMNKIQDVPKNEDQKNELKGHLALMYMQLGVFIDRTLDLAIALLDKAISDSTDLKERNELKNKRNNTKNQKRYLEGQPKNKIAALPRARLSELFSTLSKEAQACLKKNTDIILDEFAAELEDLDLDLHEGLTLKNSLLGEETTLIDFLKSGLGEGKGVSQQVLFGGMNEIGIDTKSSKGKKLLPLEFRNLFNQRVTWGELEKDAIEILKWSRDPEKKSLRRQK